MTAKELHGILAELIERGHGNNVVRVPVIPPGTPIGPSPTVEITEVASGFDWDAKTVFLHPEKELFTDIDSLYKQARVLHSVRNAIYLMRMYPKEHGIENAILGIERALKRAGLGVSNVLGQ